MSRKDQIARYGLTTHALDEMVREAGSPFGLELRFLSRALEAADAAEMTQWLECARYVAEAQMGETAALVPVH